MFSTMIGFGYFFEKQFFVQRILSKFDKRRMLVDRLAIDLYNEKNQKTFHKKTQKLHIIQV